MTDLKFGDIIEWISDGYPVRWMIVAGHPTYQTQYEAAWMVSPEDSLIGYHVGDVKTIGTSEGQKVIRG